MASWETSGGATQWRHPWGCLDRWSDPTSTKEHVMHSEVSWNNREYFPREDRVPDRVTVDDLEELLERASDGEAVIVCNSCQAIKVVGA